MEEFRKLKNGSKFEGNIARARALTSPSAIVCLGFLPSAVHARGRRVYCEIRIGCLRACTRVLRNHSCASRAKFHPGSEAVGKRRSRGRRREQDRDRKRERKGESTERDAGRDASHSIIISLSLPPKDCTALARIQSNARSVINTVAYN